MVLPHFLLLLLPPLMHAVSDSVPASTLLLLPPLMRALGGSGAARRIQGATSVSASVCDTARCLLPDPGD